jgi:flagellar hook-associated protein 1 FlgK
VHAGTRDITSVIQSGKLGGLLTARDQEIASYLAQLDDLAAGIISKVNTQHALGSDLNGNAGGDFFVPFVQTIPGSNYGAAHSMAVAITDTDEVAAAETGAGVGSNANAKLLADIQNQPLLAGNSASLNQLYSNLVFRIGLDSKAALDGLETQQQLLRQVENQRDAATGVNLDDEAVNLLRFQRAYQANARFISVIDGLIGDLFQILGG